MNHHFFSRALGCSLALHISIIVIALIVSSMSPSRKAMPSYVVTLVSPPGDTDMTAATSTIPPAQPAPEPEQKEEPKPTPKPAAKPEPIPQKKAETTPLIPKKTREEKLADDQLLSDRVAALKAKKRIEKMVAQRRSAEVSKSKVSTPATAAKGGRAGGGDYISLVTTKIHQNWIYPESAQQHLEMTVLLRVRKDGTASVERIIKSSGNPLFDRSVQRAISKANPFPPPPQEMEIEARFTP